MSIEIPDEVRELSDGDLVFHLRDAMAFEEQGKRNRQMYEAAVTERLIAKEAAGEKARIQMVTGEDVSLGEEMPYFKYQDKDLDKAHEWVKEIGLGNLIKEPKIHHASLNSNLRELIKDGIDIPPFIEIDTRRQLSKRGMK